MSFRCQQGRASQVVVVIGAGIVIVAVGAYSLLHQQSAPPVATPSDSTAAKIQSFYSSYSDNPSAYARAAEVTPALRALLLSESNGPDPVLCSRNLPRNVSARLVSSTSTTKLIRVTEQFSSSVETVTVTVDVGSGLISAISCPSI